MMIACDNEICVREWFHPNCVQLKAGEIPEGKWYCPDCDKKKKKKKS